MSIEEYPTSNQEFSYTREPQRSQFVPKTGDQLFFLRRLRRLTALNRFCVEELQVEDWEMKLLGLVIFSTYKDCVDLGVGDDAREILIQHRSAVNPNQEKNINIR